MRVEEGVVSVGLIKLQVNTVWYKESPFPSLLRLSFSYPNAGIIPTIGSELARCDHDDDDNDDDDDDDEEDDDNNNNNNDNNNNDNNNNNNNN